MATQEHYTQYSEEDRLKLIEESVNFIYSGEEAPKVYEEVVSLINAYKEKIESTPYYLSEKDIILIT